MAFGLGGGSPEIGIRLSVDNRGLKGALAEARGEVGKTGGFFRNAFAVAGGIAIEKGIRGAITTIRGGITAASDLNESLSKSTVIFGDHANSIERWGNSANKTLGLSKGAAIEAAATWGDLFQNSGFAQGDAAKASTDIVQLSADLASFNNIAGGTKQVEEDLRSGIFGGETEPLRKYGININAAAVEQEKLRLGLEDINEETKQHNNIVARQSIVYRATQRAQGDFARTQSQFANSSRTLSATWTNFQALLARGVVPALALGMRATTGFLEATGGLIEYVAAVVDGGERMNDWLTHLPEPLRRAASGFALLVDGLNDTIRAFRSGGLQAALDELGRIQGDRILGGLRVLGEEAWGAFSGAFLGLARGGIALASVAVDVVGWAIGKIPDLWGWLMRQIGVGPIGDGTDPGAVVTLTDVAVNVLSFALQGGLSLADDVTAYVRDDLWPKAKGAAQSLADWGVDLGTFGVQGGVTLSENVTAFVKDTAWPKAIESAQSVAGWTVDLASFVAQNGATLWDDVKTFVQDKLWPEALTSAQSVAGWTVDLASFVAQNGKTLWDDVKTFVQDELWPKVKTNAVDIADAAVTITSLKVKSIAAWAEDATSTIQAWIDEHPPDSLTSAITLTDFTPAFGELAAGKWSDGVVSLLTADPIDVTPEIELNVQESVEAWVRDAGDWDWNTILTGAAFLVSLPSGIGNYLATHVIPDVVKVGRAALFGALQGVFTDQTTWEQVGPFGEFVPVDGKTIAERLVESLGIGDALAGITSPFIEISTTVQGWITDFQGAIDAITEPSIPDFILDPWAWIKAQIAGAESSSEGQQVPQPHGGPGSGIGFGGTPFGLASFLPGGANFGLGQGGGGGASQMEAVGAGLAEALARGIDSGAPNALMAGQNLGTGLVNVATEFVPKLTTVGTDLSEGVGRGIDAGAPRALTATQNLGIGTTNVINGFLDDFTVAGNNISVNTGFGISQAAPAVSNAASGAVSGAIGAANAAAGGFVFVGQNIGAGLIAGINSTVSAIARAAANAVNQAEQAARDAADAASPSRLFMRVGADMGAGLALGMAASVPGVTAASLRLAYSAMPPDVMQRLQGAVRPQGGASGRGGGTTIKHNHYGPQHHNYQGDRYAEARERSRRIMQARR